MTSQGNLKAGVRAIFNSSEKSTTVNAVVTVQPTIASVVTNVRLTKGLDDANDRVGTALLIELVAAQLDPKSGSEKPTIRSFARLKGKDGDKILYESSFNFPQSFGEVGAILVENEHHQEIYITTIVFHGFPDGDIVFTCNSWVQSKFDNAEKRVFFDNKSYLPSQTPSGLRRFRDQELNNLRGDGKGERKKGDRIYDYEVYNDLGDPDISDELARPVLGGGKQPYPRRCRTGRPKTKKDPLSETRSSFVYIPRDEAFSEIKMATFRGNSLIGVTHSLVSTLKALIVDDDKRFPNFTAIDKLFKQGTELPASSSNVSLRDILPNIVKAASDAKSSILRFDTPDLIERDTFIWMNDSEFARQTLAGANPCCIKLVEEWPMKSKLDPAIYGPSESAITKEMVEKEIGGYTTVEEALKEKKLFVLDYYDLLLPYVQQVRELKGRTLYGSRTLFFLTPEGTLRPIAIELTRPPINGKPIWQQVFQPSGDATSLWLWRLAKAHVLAHDSGYHQLVSHWLRTHCCTEPYIIAANRQLSAMHPIYRLLHPHFRYTMEINALARERLISANVIIEYSFSPGKYSMFLSSVVYDQQWQFNLQALPADLISRGMAVKDPNAPHGLKLTIEDYPYANDGLLLWDAIKQWVTDYVSYYYLDSKTVQSDTELQAWWTEIQTIGHGDKKNEAWWPSPTNPDTLIEILTTIIWVASGHHAAVNFGQYDYGGYFPNRPTIARTRMPTEEANEAEFKQFMEKPLDFLLNCFPSQLQALMVMSVMDVLSSHSPDEEYIGGEIQPYWAENATIKVAFERFRGKMKDLGDTIDARNANSKLKNRYGAGVVPYELLKPFSGGGVTGSGVPNSISI